MYVKKHKQVVMSPELICAGTDCRRPSSVKWAFINRAVIFPLLCSNIRLETAYKAVEIIEHPITIHVNADDQSERCSRPHHHHHIKTLKITSANQTLQREIAWKQVALTLRSAGLWWAGWPSCRRARQPHAEVLRPQGGRFRLYRFREREREM